MLDLLDKYAHGLLTVWTFVLVREYVTEHEYSLIESAGFWTLGFVVFAAIAAAGIYFHEKGDLT